MSTFSLLAKRANLEEADIDHLQRLTSSWGMLADLCFSDLVLYAPLRTTEQSEEALKATSARP